MKPELKVACIARENFCPIECPLYIITAKALREAILFVPQDLEKEFVRIVEFKIDDGKLAEQLNEAFDNCEIEKRELAKQRLIN